MMLPYVTDKHAASTDNVEMLRKDCSAVTNVYLPVQAVRTEKLLVLH